MTKVRGRTGDVLGAVTLHQPLERLIRSVRGFVVFLLMDLLNKLFKILTHLLLAFALFTAPPQHSLLFSTPLSLSLSLCLSLSLSLSHSLSLPCL